MRIPSLLLCLSLLLPSAAFATTPFSTDASDLWWNPDESGWGINLVQQGNLIFATLYVYGADSRARWYVASDMQAAQVPSDRPYIFAGTLYETTGPVFSAPFNPAAVTRRVVGNIAFEYTPPNTGRLTYSIDGTAVTKQLRRQTWRVNDPSGSYRGYRVTKPLNCTGAPNVTTTVQADVTVTLLGSSITMATQDNLPNCTYSGTYSQEGHLGAVTGTFSCTDSTSGPFSLTGIEIGVRGYLARFSGTLGGCQIYGHMGGVRADVPDAAQ
jgi:hypothetical protein